MVCNVTYNVSYALTGVSASVAVTLMRNPGAIVPLTVTLYAGLVKAGLLSFLTILTVPVAVLVASRFGLPKSRTANVNWKQMFRIFEITIYIYNDHKLSHFSLASISCFSNYFSYIYHILSHSFFPTSEIEIESIKKKIKISVYTMYTKMHHNYVLVLLIILLSFLIFFSVLSPAYSPPSPPQKKI